MKHSLSVSFVCPSALIYTPPPSKFLTRSRSKDLSQVLFVSKTVKSQAKTLLKTNPKQQTKALPRLMSVKVHLQPLAHKSRWEIRGNSEEDISVMHMHVRLPPLDFENTQASLPSPLRPWSAARSKRAKCVVV